MSKITVSTTRSLDAPVEAVWEVLADFQNIDQWTDSVKTATQTSDLETGVGAKRVCELAPMGTVNEEVLEFVPNEKIRIAISDTKSIPIKSSDSTFSVTPTGPNTTDTTFTAAIEPKGGFLAGFIGKRLEGRLPKVQATLLEELGAEAAKRATAHN